MKTFKFLILMLVAACGLTSCDDLLKDDEPNFNDYYAMTITGCERVGSVLIVDFTVKNISKKDEQNFNLSSLKTYDNLGNSYTWVDNGETYVAFGEGDYSNNRTTSIRSGETIRGSFKITNFDPTNSATRIELAFNCKSPVHGFSGGVSSKNIPVTDHRVMSNGIQTNDRRLDYTMRQISYDENGNCIVAFSLKNNTGKELKNLKLGSCRTLDNFGNYYDYWSTGISFDGENFSRDKTTNVPVDGTIDIFIKIDDFDENAYALNASIGIESSYVVFNDNTIRLLNISLN